MLLSERIATFSKLGEVISDYNSAKETSYNSDFDTTINRSCIENNWFTEIQYKQALGNIGKWLSESNLKQWLKPYSMNENIESNKTIAVIMAGNIPLVGFQDFLCVLVSGNKVLAKLSHNDKYVLPLLAKILTIISPNFKDKIVFTESKLENFDAVIATGNNNSARYFEYYFSKYPHITRMNRNSIAILNGNETTDELDLLGNDMFQYFGLGCRNVSKLYLPTGYDIQKLFIGIDAWRDISNNNKYANNYTYNRALLLMNEDKYFDTGFAIYRESNQISTPASVYNYEFYDSISSVKTFINDNKDKIQCIVSNDKSIDGAINFGQTQSPQLWDYADGVDVIEFLLRLKN